jgi:hypothetical protein
VIVLVSRIHVFTQCKMHWRSDTCYFYVYWLLRGGRRSHDSEQSVINTDNRLYKSVSASALCNFKMFVPMPKVVQNNSETLLTTPPKGIPTLT